MEIGSILFGKYRIENEIGKGGFGSVYKASDIRLHRPAAIKTLLYGQTSFDQRYGEGYYRQYVTRFEREAKLSGYFTGNPNVVTVYGLEQDDEDNFYLILEYLENGSLDNLIKQHGKMPVVRACDIALDICRGLSAIHNHPTDIVHRDLKPSNILLRPNGVAAIADFGIAQVGHESERSNMRGMDGTGHPGSRPYMSPEQRNSLDYLTPASDLYSLGLVIYEMLTGVTFAKYKKLPPSAENPAIPVWLDQIILKLLETEPENRYQKAEEVARAIHNGLTGGSRPLSYNPAPETTQTRVAVWQTPEATVPMPPPPPNNPVYPTPPYGLTPPQNQAVSQPLVVTETATTPITPPVVLPPGSSGNTSQPATLTAPPPPPPKKSNKGLLIGLGAAVILLLIGGIVTVAILSGQSTSNANLTVLANTNSAATATVSANVQVQSAATANTQATVSFQATVNAQSTAATIFSNATATAAVNNAPENGLYRQATEAYTQKRYGEAIPSFKQLEEQFSSKFAPAKNEEINTRLTESFCRYALSLSLDKKPVDEVIFNFQQCFEVRDSGFLASQLQEAKGRYEAEKIYKDGLDAFNRRDWLTAIDKLANIFDNINRNFRDTGKLLYSTYIEYASLQERAGNYSEARDFFTRAGRIPVDAGGNPGEAAGRLAFVPTPTPVIIPATPRPTSPPVAPPSAARPGTYNANQCNTTAGSWSVVPGGYRGSSANDAFCLFNWNFQTRNFVLEGWITIESGEYGALVFGSTSDPTNGSFSVGLKKREQILLVDYTDQTLSGGYKRYAAIPLEVQNGATYKLRVEVSGANVKVFVDGAPIPQVNVIIPSPSGWFFGLNAYQGTAIFENVVLTVN
jgi:serine/threonine protein kinase/tetratricopeptide (TPR) repeat protein